jgi:hypothetical protein
MWSILEKFQVNELYFCVKRYPINNIKLEGVSQNLRMLNGHFKTTSDNFFANFMNRFHKNEVQTSAFLHVFHFCRNL